MQFLRLAAIPAFILLSYLVGASLALSGTSISSPSQVVQHWITVYPKDLNTAVGLTTATLRDGLAPPLFGRDAADLSAGTEWRTKARLEFRVPSPHRRAFAEPAGCGGDSNEAGDRVGTTKVPRS